MPTDHLNTPDAAPLKSAHAGLLNRLNEMQQAPYYAVARGTLAEAERTIVQLEARVAQLQQEVTIGDSLVAERDRLLEAIPACDAHGDKCVPHALEWVDLAKIGVEIADEAMFEWLDSYGSIGVDKPDEIGLVGDFGIGEVFKLDEACDELKEAYEWLRARGYVELGTDDDGEFIKVLRRPE